MKAQYKVGLKACTALAVVFACFTSSGDALASSYETLKARRASDILPKEMLQGKHYRIDETVLYEGYMHIYTVKSEFGDFTARGDAMLRRLLREIGAIADLRERSTARALADAAVKSAIDPFEAVGALLTDPVDTLVAIPRGVHRLLESGVKSVERERTDYEDSDLAALLAVSSYKRKYAAKHNVDVYSSNEVLQKELDRVAWASVPGYLSVSVALTPVQGAAVIAYKVFGTVDWFNEVIKENAPADLHVINEKKLKHMNIPGDLIQKFLTHPIFSPRHQTVITFCLADLSQPKGRDLFLWSVLNALSEEEALFYQQIAELFRAYNDKESPIVEIRRFNRITLGLAKNGAIFIAAPFDHGIWTEHAKRAFDGLIGSYPAGTKGRRIDFWITGTLSELARKELSERGIVVREDVDREVELMD